jgi:Domain of unknown function (DUF4304)
MTARSKDPLIAATSTYFAPLLREHGFRKYTRRSFGRVTDNCVFQVLELQQSAYGGKGFAVNYASILITRLQEHVGSTTFRRLPRGKSHDGWWGANTSERADESMKEICDTTRNIAIPWFNSTSTDLGLARELTFLTEHGNAHTFFELGCCYVTAADLPAASTPLQEAIRRFQNIYDANSQCTWAMKERLLAEELVAALASGTYASLLSRWREQTVANLSLKKVIS